MNDQKRMPGGSSVFAQAMRDVQPAPVMEVPTINVTDKSNRTNDTKHDHHHHNHDDGKVVHGLHHCYKVGGGHCETSFRCNHDHARASNGHVEEISKLAALSPLSPTPRRRMSLVAPGGHLLSPEDDFRPRCNSDALNKRRNTIVGSGSNSPSDKNSPGVSPAPRRRGSNAVLHSDELHYVYDQYLANKGKK